MTKELGAETCLRKGVVKEEKFPNIRSFQTSGHLLTGGSVGSFGISEGNITRRKE